MQTSPTRIRPACAGGIAQALLLGLAMLAQVAAAPAADIGRLWQISRDGQLRGHLFATMHLDDPEVTALPAALAAALADADRLLLEVRLDPAAMAEYGRRIWLPAGEDLADHLAPELLARYLGITAAYGLDPARARMLRPWAASNLIARPPPTGRPVLDEVLLQWAEARNLPVDGLETMAALIDTLESMATAEQVVMLEDTITNHDVLAEEIVALRRHYLAGDLPALFALTQDDYEDPELAARFLDALLYERNDRWLPDIEAALARERVVIAVGALHLPGQRGLLRQLRAAGWTVAPVAVDKP